MAVSISLAITQNSQSIANNTSNVTVKVTAKWTYGSHNATGQCTGSITIDGTKYSFSGIKFNTSATTSGSQVIMTKTVDVTHASDGKKTLSCSASFVTGVSSGTVSCSGSKALTTIHRKSTLSVANGTLGTAQTLTVTRQSSSFTHSIKVVCGKSTLYIKADGSTSTSEVKHSDTSIPFTPPLSFAAQNTTGTSVSVEYTITTYNGSTNLGSNTYTKTCTIPASVKPTVSLTVEDAMGYSGMHGGYVQGMSKFKITVTASGSQGSTIKSYQTKADGKTYTTASITTNAISGSGTLTITSTVTDSRGRTATASKSVTVLAYAKPKITSLKVFRSNSSGNASSSGAYLTATFSYSVTSLTNNTTTLSLQYKKSSATSYSNGTISENKCTFAADTASSYDIRFVVADKFFGVNKTATGSSVSKLFSWFSQTSSGVKSYGWAFGKVAELIGYLDIAFKTMFRDHAYFTNNTCIYGTKTDGTKREVINPINTNGNLVLGWDNYEAQDGNTNIYGYDVFHGVSNIATPGTYKPYLRQGDSVNINYQGAGYLTNGSTEVHIMIPLSKPVVGSPTVTVKSTNGCILRQENKYTHGSSATVRVTPSTLQGFAYHAACLRVILAFSTTTNAINNSAIGIHFEGTVEFS